MTTVDVAVTANQKRMEEMLQQKEEQEQQQFCAGDCDDNPTAAPFRVLSDCSNTSSDDVINDDDGSSSDKGQVKIETQQETTPGAVSLQDKEDDDDDDDDDDDSFGDFCVMGSDASNSFLTLQLQEEPSFPASRNFEKEKEIMTMTVATGKEADDTGNAETAGSDIAKVKEYMERQEKCTTTDKHSTGNRRDTVAAGNTRDARSVLAPAAPATVADTMRKAGVAVAGGTITAIGLIMIPLPTPMGCVVAGSGMALLGTEFEAANRIMANVQSSAEAARDKLIENVNQTIEDDGIPEEEREKPDIIITSIQKNRNGNLGVATKEREADSSCAEEGAINYAQQRPVPAHNSQEEETDIDGDDASTSEIVIAVNADGYFETDDSHTNHNNRNTTHEVNGPATLSFRQRWSREAKGFLATSVLPLLHRTKQYNTANEGAAAAEDDTR